MIPARVRLLGEPVDLVTAPQVLSFADRTVARGRKAIIANHNLHSLHMVRRDARMRAFYEMADLIEIDSMPLVAWGRATGKPTEASHRCTYLDWRDDFWAMAREKGWRVFFLGGAPGVAEAAARRLRLSNPGMSLRVHHGYFDRTPGGPENEAVLREIAAFDPDVILVGMGMPIQEAWIADNYARLRRGVVFSVGAAFDFEAGVQTAAPRWAGQVGLEWLFRFAGQPRRLFSRYFVEPWSLMGAAAGDVFRALTNAPQEDVLLLTEVVPPELAAAA